VAFFDCHFFSETLGLSVSAYVLLPQKSAVKPGAVDKGRKTNGDTLSAAWLV
jgi:hypothetical protein